MDADDDFNFKRERAANRTLRFWPELDQEIQAIAREETERRRSEGGEDEDRVVTYTDVVMTFCSAGVRRYRRRFPRSP